MGSTNSTGNMPRHFNARVIGGVVDYCEELFGRPGLEEALKQAGVSYSDITNHENWISAETYEYLLHLLVDRTGDPLAPFKIGLRTLSKERLGSLWFIIGLANLSSIRSLYKVGIESCSLFNRSADWKILDISANKVMFKITPRAGITIGKLGCLHRQGAFCAVPILFGMPQAECTESKCVANGDNCCIEEYRWQNRLGRIYTLLLPLCLLLIAFSAMAMGTIKLSMLGFMTILLIGLLLGFIVDDARIIRDSERINKEQNDHLRSVLEQEERKYDELQSVHDELKRAYDELIIAKKLEPLGVLAGGIAHDFNNLLAGIIGNLDLMHMKLAAPTAPANIISNMDEAEKAVLRARDLTGQLLTFAKGGYPVKEAASIGELLIETTHFALTGSNVSCQFSIPKKLWAVHIDKGQVSQVINNLVLNAKQAMPDGGIVTISAKNVELMDKGELQRLGIPEGRYVCIKVDDTGLGIPEQNLNKIFDPYFSTKSDGQGLGLAGAFSIAQKHGGTLVAESEERRGSSFFLYLPVSEHEVKPATYDIKALHFGHGHILVMDDEKMLRDILQGMLEYLGYTCKTTQNGEELIDAYTRCKESAIPVDAIITDLVVPGGMGGKQAVTKLLAIDPTVKVIAVSGYNDDPVIGNCGHYGFTSCLKKPFKMAELSSMLHDLLTVDGNS